MCARAYRLVRAHSVGTCAAPSPSARTALAKTSSFVPVSPGVPRACRASFKADSGSYNLHCRRRTSPASVGCTRTPFCKTISMTHECPQMMIFKSRYTGFCIAKTCCVGPDFSILHTAQKVQQRERFECTGLYPLCVRLQARSPTLTLTVRELDAFLVQPFRPRNEKTLLNVTPAPHQPDRERRLELTERSASGETVQ